MGALSQARAGVASGFPAHPQPGWLRDVGRRLMGAVDPDLTVHTGHADT